MLKTTTLGLSALALSMAAVTANAACNSVGNFTTTHNNQINSWSQLTYSSGRLTLKNGSDYQLVQSLQMATDTGKPITIEGSYPINTTRKVKLRNRLSVTATNATFTGTSSLDGDLLEFDTDDHSHDCSNDSNNQRFIWNGGKINMSAAKLSTVVPGSERLGGNAQGTSKTADGISVRAHLDGEIHVQDVTIRNVEFYGTKQRGQDYRYAGGDSGFLLSGPGSTNLVNNKFYGVRDAAIYISADDGTGTLGGNFTATKNRVEHAYDGITSKRGADNIDFIENTIYDAVVGISTKLGRSGLDFRAVDVTINGNVFERIIRGISLELTDDYEIKNNTFNEFGKPIKNTHNNVTVGASKNARASGVYEAISLNGTHGVPTITGNTFNGDNVSKAYALVYRSYEGSNMQNFGSAEITNFRSSSVNTFDKISTRVKNGASL